MDEKTPAKIIGIQFSILSPDEIKRNSVAEITSRDTYINNKPVIGGLFDPRMGVLEPGLICPTDGLDYMNTPGYFGHIELARPVYYIQYLETIKKIFSTKIFQNFFWKGRPGSMGINPGPKCIITNVQTSYQNILDNVSGHKHGATGIRKLLPIVNFLFYLSSVCSFEFIGVVNISSPIVILWISISFVAFTKDRSSISTDRGSLLALLL